MKIKISNSRNVMIPITYHIHAIAMCSWWEKALFDLIWQPTMKNFWNGNCWVQKINHCGHSLNMRREFENFQPWGRLESIWNQWTVPSTHIFKVSIPQILSPKVTFFSLPLSPIFWFQFQESFLKYSCLTTLCFVLY